MSKTSKANWRSGLNPTLPAGRAIGAYLPWLTEPMCTPEASCVGRLLPQSQPGTPVLRGAGDQNHRIMTGLTTLEMRNPPCAERLESLSVGAVEDILVYYTYQILWLILLLYDNVLDSASEPIWSGPLSPWSNSRCPFPPTSTATQWPSCHYCTWHQKAGFSAFSAFGYGQPREKFNKAHCSCSSCDQGSGRTVSHRDLQRSAAQRCKA